MTFTWAIYTVVMMIFFMQLIWKLNQYLIEKNKYSWRYVNIYSQ